MGLLNRRTSFLMGKHSLIRAYSKTPTECTPLPLMSAGAARSLPLWRSFSSPRPLTAVGCTFLSRATVPSSFHLHLVLKSQRATSKTVAKYLCETHWLEKYLVRLKTDLCASYNLPLYREQDFPE